MADLPVYATMLVQERDGEWTSHINITPIAQREAERVTRRFNTVAVVVDPETGAVIGSWYHGTQVYP